MLESLNRIEDRTLNIISSKTFELIRDLEIYANNIQQHSIIQTKHLERRGLKLVNNNINKIEGCNCRYHIMLEEYINLKILLSKQLRQYYEYPVKHKPKILEKQVFDKKMKLRAIKAYYINKISKDNDTILYISEYSEMYKNFCYIKYLETDKKINLIDEELNKYEIAARIEFKNNKRNIKRHLFCNYDDYNGQEY